MKFFIVTAVGLLSIVEAVTPVQKVLQMMGDMKNKALKEKENEIAVFGEFTEFCEDTEVTKSRAIKEGTEQSEKLSADIQKYTSNANVLSQEILKLDESISLAEKDKADATRVREGEKADFDKTHADYVESIEDLEVASMKLKEMMTAVKSASAASLLQNLASAPHMPDRARRTLMTFIAEGSDEDRAFSQGIHLLQQPQATTVNFESKSGGIVQMMDDLKEKLEDERTKLEQEEMAKQHSFDMMAASLTDAINQQTDSRSDKTATKKQMETSAADAKGELATTQTTLAEDTKYLDDLKTTCAQKQSDFEARQKMRAEELTAIDQAIEIISSGSVAGSAGKHLPGLVQVKSSTSLVQLRAGAKSPSQDAVASYLAKQGQRLHSTVLAALSLHVSSDPFVKIRKMIQDMITKLTEEAQEEAEHKGFCDSELSTNKQTRDDKTTQADTLTANIEQMTAEAQKLATEIEELTADVAASDAAVAKATKIRAEEKTKNTATIEDAKVAKAAVEKALGILKDFYEKAASATALVQTKTSVALRQPMPETFDEPFTGTGGEGGVIGMLEVILSDFERLEAETTEEELTSQKEYDTFMADSAEDKETKTTAIKEKTSAKTTLESDTAQAKKDLKSTNEELDAALAYFEKLKPSCIDAGESYEERVARRKEEIESLKEALKILEGETI